jgi:hypothetical protein
MIRNPFAASQFHKAVILGQHIQPAFKVGHLVVGQFPGQLFENLDNGILSIIPVSQIFQGDPVNQMHIAGVEAPQQIEIAGTQEIDEQILIRPALVFSADLKHGWTKIKKNMGRFMESEPWTHPEVEVELKTEKS